LYCFDADEACFPVFYQCVPVVFVLEHGLDFSDSQRPGEPGPRGDAWSAPVVRLPGCTSISQ
jgi:hypothetical protein